MENSGNFWKKMEIFTKNGKKWKFLKRNERRKLVSFLREFFEIFLEIFDKN